MALSAGARRVSGSSPLARGTPDVAWLTAEAEGLIPARAGNTGRDILVFLSVWAHPRSRGEHGGAVNKHECMTGSSPLARGTPGNRVRVSQRRGLIPARAGNT